MAIKSLIVIPARYASTRFPGKPLVMIAGKTMLQRVYENAMQAIQDLIDVEIVIATDDQRIFDHAKEIGAKGLMTPSSCRTGSDRALAACESLDHKPGFILNLQGDTPLLPPAFIKDTLVSLLEAKDIDVATPVLPLSWDALDALREDKKQTPFSGTTVTINPQGNALWFSKQIIPAIRNEAALRVESAMSPVYRHIGLYGFTYKALKRFVSLPEAHYEKLEGLEQLRMLENGMTIRAVKVDPASGPSTTGVDSPEDARRVEAIILSQQKI